MSGYSIPRMNDVDPRAATGSVLILRQGGQKCCFTVPVTAPDARKDVRRPNQAAEASAASGVRGMARRDDAEYLRVVRNAQVVAAARYGVDAQLLRKPWPAKMLLLE